MSWTVIWAMAAGAYSFKVLGVIVLGRFSTGSSSVFNDVTSLIPAALFAAIVVVQTYDLNGSLTLDARAAGVMAGTVAAWRRAPFVVVVVVAMSVAALARRQTLL